MGKRSMRGLVAVAALLFAAFPALPPAPSAEAEERVVSLLSQNRISINTNFDGSELVITGAIERFSAPPEGDPEIVVVVIGPSHPALVRKKENRFGIWINDAGVRIDETPSFYAISSTGPLHDVMSHAEDLRHRVGLEHAVRLIGESTDEFYPEDYRVAAIRLNTARGFYFEDPGGVAMVDDLLFQTRVQLPSQLTEGDYRVRIFLLRDREVVDLSENIVPVRKASFERLIHNTATERPVIYGTISIILALAAGWLASAIFRIIFP